MDIASKILEYIEKRKVAHIKDYDDFSKIENVTADVLYPIAVRIDELDQVIEIVKECMS